MPRDIELKRKLRRLKLLEVKLRFGGTNLGADRLVWTHFFSVHPEETGCKYPFLKLLDQAVRRNAFDDYITTLYYQYFRERGMLEDSADPLTLAELGLPPDATLQEIKARFRSLVKKHHPDVGGEHSKMIELIQQYRNLMDEIN